MKRLLLLSSAILIFCCYSLSANAEIKCTGIVVDEMNVPIIGATVSQDGTTNATATDIDGKFTLNVADNSKLQIS